MKIICHSGFVGIDVSKEWIDVAFEDQCFRVKQCIKAIDTFIRDKLISLNPKLCVLESTGGYERLIVDCLDAAKLKIHIAHPSRVREFAKARGLLAKTDRLDAHLLAAYGQFIGESQVSQLLTKTQRKLADLRSRYEQIKEMLHAESCRLGGSIDARVKLDIEETIIFLKKRREAIIDEMQLIVSEDEVLSHQQAILSSVKGVGKITALTLLICLPELGHLSRKKIASLVGVAPITKQSGKKQSYARVQCGRSNTRHTLYMAALVGSQRNETLKEFYERLRQAGKPGKVALVAVMRKLLVILNAMIRDNRAWEQKVMA